MTTFPNLAEAIQREAEQQNERTRHFILYGYMPSWAAGNRNDPDRGIRQHATAHTWEQYQSGEIDRGTAAVRAIKRAERAVSKSTVKKLDALLRVAEASAPQSIEVFVDWKRSSVWGYNPTATAYATGTNSRTCRTEGHASGCGYDKRSAAVAEALNQCDGVLNLLYSAAEAALQAGARPVDYDNGCKSWRDVLGYGTGCAVLPYFEGGVGVNCFWDVFRKLGYSIECNEAEKHRDFYMIVKEA